MQRLEDIINLREPCKGLYWAIKLFDQNKPVSVYSEYIAEEIINRLVELKEQLDVILPVNTPLGEILQLTQTRWSEDVRCGEHKLKMMPHITPNWKKNRAITVRMPTERRIELIDSGILPSKKTDGGYVYSFDAALHSGMHLFTTATDRFDYQMGWYPPSVITREFLEKLANDWDNICDFMVGQEALSIELPKSMEDTLIACCEAEMIRGNLIRAEIQLVKKLALHYYGEPFTVARKSGCRQDFTTIKTKIRGDKYLTCGLSPVFRFNPHRLPKGAIDEICEIGTYAAAPTVTWQFILSQVRT